MKKIWKILIICGVSIMILVVSGVLFMEYIESSYQKDIEKIFGDSQAGLDNFRCQEISGVREVVCNFKIRSTDIDKIITYLNFDSSLADEDKEINKEVEHTSSGNSELLNLRGRYLFTKYNGTVDPCDFARKIDLGYEWVKAKWNPSRKGLGLTTYSGALLIYNPANGDACTIVNIA